MANQKAQNNIKIVGILFMIFAGIGFIQAVAGLINPEIMGIDAAYGTGTIIAAIIFTLVVNVIEFYFGYIAYKLRPTKVAATICFIFGILGAVGVVSTIITSGFTWSLLAELGSALLAFLYWFYYKELQA